MDVCDGIERWGCVVGGAVVPGVVVGSACASSTPAASAATTEDKGFSGTSRKTAPAWTTLSPRSPPRPSPTAEAGDILTGLFLDRAAGTVVSPGRSYR
jgi:hypothetical protein